MVGSEVGERRANNICKDEEFLIFKKKIIGDQRDNPDKR